MGREGNAANCARPRSNRMSTDLYFAYGSNLCAERLRERVPSASARGAARATGFALRLDKRGADGTAKANLHLAPGDEVWGALYALDPGDWPRLDACEPGYARFALEVEHVGARVSAQTYRSALLTGDPVAAVWYKQLIVDGARAHALPAAWCARLERLPAR